METIRPFLEGETTFFEPSDISAMSLALDDVCKALGLDGNAKAKEVVAERIIELVRRGERSPSRLRDRLLREANGEPAADRTRVGVERRD
jgi:hypothetical protein